MSQYAAEPPPSHIDPDLAEYLFRQMRAVQDAINFATVLEVPSLPERPIPGATVNLRSETTPADNGFYICVYNSQGEGEWKKLQTT